MQEFFIDYGLWLLIALLVIIGLVFLLSGRRKADRVDEVGSAPPVEQTASLVSPPPPPPAPEPVMEEEFEEEDVKKIDSEDSCPCGSGKKYKNCHGIGQS